MLPELELEGVSRRFCYDAAMLSTSALTLKGGIFRSLCFRLKKGFTLLWFVLLSYNAMRLCSS